MEQDEGPQGAESALAGGRRRQARNAAKLILGVAFWIRLLPRSRSTGRCPRAHACLAQSGRPAQLQDLPLHASRERGGSGARKWEPNKNARPQGAEGALAAVNAAKRETLRNSSWGRRSVVPESSRHSLSTGWCRERMLPDCALSSGCKPV